MLPFLTAIRTALRKSSCATCGDEGADDDAAEAAGVLEIADLRLPIGDFGTGEACPHVWRRTHLKKLG